MADMDKGQKEPVVGNDAGSSTSNESVKDARQSFLDECAALFAPSPWAMAMATAVAREAEALYVSNSRHEVYFEKPNRYPSAQPIPESDLPRVFERATKLAHEYLERRALNRVHQVEVGDVTTEDMKYLIREAAMSALFCNLSVSGAWGGLQGGERRRPR